MYALVAAYLVSPYSLPLHGDRPAIHLCSHLSIESNGVAKIGAPPKGDALCAHPRPRPAERVIRRPVVQAWADGGGMG